jgi:flagellin
MAVDIRTNPLSLKMLNNLASISKLVNNSVEKLSSGYRINSAADGAAELTLSEQLRTQVRGFDVAARNIQVGSSVVNIADSGAQQIYDKLQRIRELAVEASTATVTDFTNFRNEINALRTQIDEIANNAEFNGRELLSNAAAPTFNIQIGPNANNSMNIGSAFQDIRASSATGLNMTATLDNTNFNSNAQATSYLSTVIDPAMTILNGRITEIGKWQNALSTQASFVAVTAENLAAAEATIRNTDVAAETSKLARNQILQQVANAMLVQANNLPTLALQLLG